MDSRHVFSAPTYDDIERELLPYLSQRFASIEFAQTLIAETRRRLIEADILMLVGDSKTYVCSFAMSIGKQVLLDVPKRNILPERRVF